MSYLPSLYVIIVTTAGPEAYFKIGVSGDIFLRIVQVQTGCPLPIERVLFLPTDDMMQARSLEGRLHARFDAFHTSGEWFMFNIQDEAQKAEFHRGCAEVLETWDPNWKWQVFDEAGYRAEHEKARIAQAKAREEFSERKLGGGGPNLATAMEIRRRGKGIGLNWSRGSKLRGK